MDEIIASRWFAFGMGLFMCVAFLVVFIGGLMYYENKDDKNKGND